MASPCPVMALARPLLPGASGGRRTGGAAAPAAPKAAPMRVAALVRPDLTAERQASGAGAGPSAASADPPVASPRPAFASSLPAGEDGEALADRIRRRARERKSEQRAYSIAAVAASVGVISLAIVAVHARFAYGRPDGADVPASEAVGTMLLALGGVVGMEMYARWAHRALWHDFAPGWALHKSHHEPRTGPFEANDVFALMNAAPAMGLCLYGFLTPTLAGGLAFGAGLGITLFGILYMFIHDGLVHKRFPVGPVADVPALQRITAAHKLHHSEKYGGVPFGMFLGPQELEAIGAGDDLDKLVEEMGAARLKRSASGGGGPSA